MAELICCMLDCTRNAEWELRDGAGPDDYTHACTEHVGALLSGAVTTVTPIEHIEAAPMPTEVVRG